MKLNDDQRMLATVIPLMVILGVLFVVAMWPERQEQSSSFVGYSQSCWQEGNVLHVVTAKGDTVRLDVSKLK